MSRVKGEESSKHNLSKKCRSAKYPSTHMNQEGGSERDGQKGTQEKKLDVTRLEKMDVCCKGFKDEVQTVLSGNLPTGQIDKLKMHLKLQQYKTTL